MEIKLFGRTLFEFKKGSKGELYVQSSLNEVKESKYLPDFYRGMGNNSILEFSNSYTLVNTSAGGAVAVPVGTIIDGVKTDKPKKLSPKEVYELETLNDKAFKLNTDAPYVDAQIAEFKDKLGLIKSEEYDMRNGAQEIASIVTRLENRKKYAEFEDFYNEFPYTTTSKIDAMTKEHDYLQTGQVAQFLADMPKEATKVMKEYNSTTLLLCGKQAVFYIIADKKDFQKTSSRRDPILLAQSPFGHVWQILGAWDKEMLLLEEL